MANETMDSVRPRTVRTRYGEAVQMSARAIARAKRLNSGILGKHCTTPPPVSAKITAEPRLPGIVQKWQLIGAGKDYVAVSGNFSGKITYSDHKRKDVSRVVHMNGVPLTAPISFGTDVLGGDFAVTVVINWRRKSDGATGKTPSQTCWSRIIGINPQKKDVKAALAGLELQVIAYKESKFRQFNAKGQPLFGPPNGFGVMQIDNPAPTARQIWDWRENVKAGVSLFAAKRKEVAQHFANLYKKFPDAPKLTAEQIKLAQYQHYNTGGAATWYWTWNEAKKAWEKIPNNGYGDDCVKIEKLVAGGKPPKGWN